MKCSKNKIKNKKENKNENNEYCELSVWILLYMDARARLIVSQIQICLGMANLVPSPNKSG